MSDGRLTLGLASLVAGLIAFAIAALANYGAPGPAERLMFALGLAGMPLLSAAAQVLIVVGVWLLWRAHRS